MRWLKLTKKMPVNELTRNMFEYEEKEIIISIKEILNLIKNKYPEGNDFFYKENFSEIEYYEADLPSIEGSHAKENGKTPIENASFIKRHFLGKFLVKKIISEYLDINDLKEIQIINDKKGKPHIKYDARISGMFKKKGVRDIFISISHSKNMICGYVIFEF
jgi:phosphopantetheinyl transferase (holo-ACP synthase)